MLIYLISNLSNYSSILLFIYPTIHLSIYLYNYLSNYLFVQKCKSVSSHGVASGSSALSYMSFVAAIITLGNYHQVDRLCQIDKQIKWFCCSWYYSRQTDRQIEGYITSIYIFIYSKRNLVLNKKYQCKRLFFHN